MQEQRHPFDVERPGSRLRLRVSLHARPAPTGGVVDPPFQWEDLLDRDPPGDEERGPPAWCEPAPELVTADARVENVVLTRIVEGRVEVEDRLALTRRALAPMLEAERETVGVRLEEARAAAEGRAEAAAHPAAAFAHRAVARLAGAARGVTRALVSAPDGIANGARRATAFLSTPEGRRRFRAGLVDPHGLTGEQKAVTLFVGVGGVLVALALTHIAVTLAAPAFAPDWRPVFFLFLYGFVTSVGFPLPIEPVLLPVALEIGAPAAIATTLAAKVLAAWFVFFLGDSIGHRLRQRAESSPRLAGFLRWSESFARRFGLAAVAFFIAVPGFPDFVALYVFGSLHMRLWKFLLGVAIGGAILYSAITYGFLAWWL